MSKLHQEEEETINNFKIYCSKQPKFQDIPEFRFNRLMGKLWERLAESTRRGLRVAGITEMKKPDTPGVHPSAMIVPNSRIRNSSFNSWHHRHCPENPPPTSEVNPLFPSKRIVSKDIFSEIRPAPRSRKPRENKAKKPILYQKTRLGLFRSRMQLLKKDNDLQNPFSNENLLLKTQNKSKISNKHTKDFDDIRDLSSSDLVEFLEPKIISEEENYVRISPHDQPIDYHEPSPQLVYDIIHITTELPRIIYNYSDLKPLKPDVIKDMLIYSNFSDDTKDKLKKIKIYKKAFLLALNVKTSPFRYFMTDMLQKFIMKKDRYLSAADCKFIHRQLLSLMRKRDFRFIYRLFLSEGIKLEV